MAGDSPKTPRTVADVIAEAEAAGKVEVRTDLHGTATVRVPAGAIKPQSPPKR